MNYKVTEASTEGPSCPGIGLQDTETSHQKLQAVPGLKLPKDVVGVLHATMTSSCSNISFRKGKHLIYGGEP
jgi:hypothetical protein